MCHPPSPRAQGTLLQPGPKETRRWTLTLSAVLAFPARVADFLATLSASEVTKGVVPGATEDRAAFSVVVLIAHEAIGVLEVSAATAVQVLGPLFTHRQVPLGGQAADEALGVFCMKVERGSVVREPEASRGVGRCSTGDFWWDGNHRDRMIGLCANRLASLPMVSQRGAGMGWGKHTAHCRERG